MTHFKRLAAGVLLGVASLAAQATPVVVDVSGAQSINTLPEDGNTVWFINIGANAVLNSLDWAVTLNALAPSLLSEMQVSFGNSSGLDMLTIAPGALDSVSGSASYSGSLSLAGLGISAGTDGLLRIAFSESTKDFGTNVAEGQWLSGNLTFDVSAVPEPASAAFMLLGLGLVAATRRSRHH